MRKRTRAIAAESGRVQLNDNKEVHHVHSVHGKRVHVYDSPAKHLEKHIKMLKKIKTPSFIKI